MTNPNITSKARILIIEDSLGVARALNRTLSLPKGGGHWVEIYDSGEAALDRLRDAHFDLLITDLRLPGINGLAVLEHARQISPETRSMLITAFGSPLVEERARQLANAYLAKPFHLHDLIRIVQQVLSEPVARKQPLIREDDARHQTTDMTAVVDQRKAMYLKVLACDLDGTLADQGQIAPEIWETLHQHHRDTAADLITILVTGHTLESYTAGEGCTASEAQLCQAIVAENGAVVYFPQRDAVMLPFGHLAPAVVKCLETLDVPLKHGKAIITTQIPHDEAILEALQEASSETAVEYNLGTVMVLPPGATKGTGLQYALHELGYSPHNVVACGDAENDRSLFEMSELAVAMANAPPDIQALADAVLPQADGAGVQALMVDLLSGRVPDYLPRPSRRLPLGHRTSGAPVHLDPFSLVNSNLGIFGANAGDGDLNKHWDRSWLAGSLAGKLSERGYQVCVIDPQGDYRALGTNSHSWLLSGPETPLPPVEDVIDLCESKHVNLVLDLSACSQVECTAYVQELLPAMLDLRTRLGRPHWFLMDKVDRFCPSASDGLTDVLLESMQGGGFSIAGDRPSQVAPTLLEALDCWLVTRLRPSEEIGALRPFLTQHAGGPAALSQLSSLPAGRAYLYIGDIEQPSLSTKGFIKLRVGF